MLRRHPRSTLFPTRRSSDLSGATVLCLRVAKRLAEVSALRMRLETEQADDVIGNHGRSVRANGLAAPRATIARSEEHTSELQSQSNLVCRLLLEKKNRAENN